MEENSNNRILPIDTTLQIPNTSTKDDTQARISSQNPLLSSSDIHK